DAEAAAVMDADHVAGPRLLHGHTLLGQELLRLREPHVLSAARVAHDHTRLEPARTDADERDAVPVLRVHVRLDLEHEAGERCVVRPDDAVPGLAWWRRGREFEEVLEERLDAEVGERAAEERRRDLAAQERVRIERTADRVQERDLLAQPGERRRADPLLDLRRV